MTRSEGIEFLYRMFERKKWEEIRLKDLEMILLTVIEMEKENSGKPSY